MDSLRDDDDDDEDIEDAAIQIDSSFSSTEEENLDCSESVVVDVEGVDETKAADNVVHVVDDEVLQTSHESKEEEEENLLREGEGGDLALRKSKEGKPEEEKEDGAEEEEEDVMGDMCGCLFFGESRAEYFKSKLQEAEDGVDKQLGLNDKSSLVDKPSVDNRRHFKQEINSEQQKQRHPMTESDNSSGDYVLTSY